MNFATPKKHSKTAAGLAFAIGIATISTIAFAGVSHNTSRSNTGMKFGGSDPVSVVYDFKLNVKFRKKRSGTYFQGNESAFGSSYGNRQ